ncbi:MAG: S-layer homology domain-containing protein, partial [Desulfotomaculales bacterium]
KKELAENKIDLNQKVIAEKGAVITDAKAEMALVVPAEALKTDTEISVQKKLFPYAGETDGVSAPAVPAGYRPISPLYRLGPEGTFFNKPVTLNIRIIIPPLVRPENLALAWYDRAEGRWEAVPAVVDAPKGLILARLTHFSDFAVFAKDSKKSFADVTSDNFGWARETIETLAGAGILAGVDGIHFEPERAVTRAEFAALLAKALALREKREPKNSFRDVKATDWYAGAVAAVAGADLVKGYEDGTFRPEQKITREEVAAVLARVTGLKPAGAKLSFQDKGRISPWARDVVAAAAAQGLVKGFPDGTFRPDAPAGRAECAAMVYRVLAGCEN